MKILVATYELGHAGLMIGYTDLYLRRFDWDPSAENNEGRFSALKLFVDNLLALMPLSRDGDGFRKIHEIEKQLERTMLLGPSDQTIFPNPTMRLVKELVRATSHEMKKYRRLHPWYILGQVMANCYIDNLKVESQKVLQCFPRFLAAVAKLPTHRLQRIEVLRRLSEAPRERCPLRNIRDALNDHSRARRCDDRERPALSAGRRLRALHNCIKFALESESDPPLLQFHKESRQDYLILNGRAYPVSYNQLVMTKAIYEANGKTVNGAEMDVGNASHERKKMPKEIKDIIGTRKGRNGGFFLLD